MAGRWVIGALVALAGVARAAPRKSFVTLDRQDDATRVGVSYGHDVYDADRLSGHRIELYAQIASEGTGAYARLSLSSVSVDLDRNFGDEFEEGGGSSSASGNSGIEIGTFGVWKNDGYDVVLRGGLVLPTADDSFDGASANVLTAFERLTDFADDAPNALGLRPSLSVITGDVAFLRLDLGLDLLVDVSSDDDQLHLDDNEVFARVNAGAGVHGGGFAATLELANLANLSADGDWSDKALHTLAFSVGYEGAVLQPSVALVLPLDDDVKDFLDYVIAGGVQIVGLP
jgi:hypothetical protein